MALTPDFQRITATITERDIEHFYRSSAPEDFKQQVRDASDLEVRKRFVAGYLIRTKQVKPERLNSGKKAAGKRAARKKPDPIIE